MTKELKEILGESLYGLTKRSVGRAVDDGATDFGNNPIETIEIGHGLRRFRRREISFLTPSAVERLINLSAEELETKLEGIGRKKARILRAGLDELQ